MAVAGAGGTNNGVGIASTGYNSSIMPVKVLRNDCLMSALISKSEPIRFAYNNGAHVINMSYGYESSSGGDPIEADALQTAWTIAGVTNVAAAGNENSSTTNYPCAHWYVICIGASDNDGSKWASSNYGSWVDFAAPGIGIWSASWNGDGLYISDTSSSSASAQVAGICALMKSIGKSPNAQMDAFVGTARPTSPSGWVAFGYIDGGGAVNYP